MGEVQLCEGQVLGDKYRVEQVLAVGGMGVVVSARHVALDQKVAIKVLRQGGASEEWTERFRREARAAAKLKSDHVVRVLDVGTLGSGGPFIVMEFLEGQDLAQELRCRPRQPVGTMVGWVLEAIEALAEAHAAGIVHRDLKPANLFLARQGDGTQRVKVLDFGISKGLGLGEGLNLTRSSSLMGSPLYMAPEQMRSARDVDASADIWSLGAILYEGLAGRPPYLGDNLPDLCAAVMSTEPVPLTQMRGDVPPELDQAVRRCLRKDRAERPSSVVELATTLAPFGVDAASQARRLQRLAASAPAHRVGAPAPPRFDEPPGRGERVPLGRGSTMAPWGTEPTQRVRRGRGRALVGVAVLSTSALAALGIGLTLYRGRGEVELPSPAASELPPGAATVLASPSLRPSSGPQAPPSGVAPEVPSTPGHGPARLAGRAAGSPPVRSPGPVQAWGGSPLGRFVPSAVTPAASSPATAHSAATKQREPAKVVARPDPATRVSDFGGRE